MKAVTLYRPIGTRELQLIEESEFSAFPPRLPVQPIFYPVLDEAYAVRMARDWNVPRQGAGFVTRFYVLAAFLSRSDVQIVGGSEIPAEDLDDFNRNIIGKIQVVASFP